MITPRRDDRHHVESFTEDGGRTWGWQCFTCERESVAGFDTFAEAEDDAERHARPTDTGGTDE